MRRPLLLVSTAAPATTSLLELAALGADVRLGVRAGDTGGGAEVLDGLASLAATLQQHSLAAHGRTQSQLVES